MPRFLIALLPPIWVLENLPPRTKSIFMHKSATEIATKMSVNNASFNIICYICERKVITKANKNQIL